MADNQDDEYRVGPRRPPKHSRFKPGQSGNPKGRPKRKADLDAALERELLKLVPITEAGKTRRVTKEQMLAKALTNNAIKGDHKAAMLVMQRISARQGEQTQAVAVDLPHADDEMMKRIRRRLSMES